MCNDSNLRMNHKRLCVFLNFFEHFVPASNLEEMQTTQVSTLPYGDLTTDLATDGDTRTSINDLS